MKDHFNQFIFLIIYVNFVMSNMYIFISWVSILFICVQNLLRLLIDPMIRKNINIFRIQVSNFLASTLR